MRAGVLQVLDVSLLPSRTDFGDPCIKACRRDQEDLLKFKVNVKMGKKVNLSDFEGDTAVGSRPADLSVSEKADQLGYSHITISRVYRKWSEKEKMSSEQQ